jgi:hypothetical protein
LPQKNGATLAKIILAVENEQNIAILQTKSCYLLGVNSLCLVQDVHKEQPGENTEKIVTSKARVK